MTVIQENVKSSFAATYYCSSNIICLYCGKKIKCGQSVFGVDVEKIKKKNATSKIFCKEQCAMLWKLNGDKPKKRGK